jgi:hypothetical protein
MLPVSSYSPGLSKGHADHAAIQEVGLATSWYDFEKHPFLSGRAYLWELQSHIKCDNL